MLSGDNVILYDFIITHTAHDFPGMILRSSTTYFTISHFQMLLHVMLSTKVTYESRSVNICKFHREMGDSVHLLQVGDEQGNIKDENNEFEQHKAK